VVRLRAKGKSAKRSTSRHRVNPTRWVAVFSIVNVVRKTAMNNLPRYLLISMIMAGANSMSWVQAQTSNNSGTKDEQAIQLNHLLERVGEKIQKYHDAMFSIAFTEVLRQQELKSDETPKNKPKEFVYESIVVSRTAQANQQNSFPVINRTLKSVDGKPTEQKNLPQRSKCIETNPQPAYADALTFLLPQNRNDFIFSYAGEAELEGRKTAVVLISQPPASEPVKIVQTADCFRLSRSLQMQGTIWIDPNTFDVIQLQWRQAETFSGKTSAGVSKFGIFPVFRPAKEINYEKQETTIRFRPVTFQNPEQVLLLPSSRVSAWILKGAKIAGFRVTSDYSRYRRFLTTVEIKDPGEN
jgi:hypothetical protein